MQVDAFIFQAPPEPFDKDVIEEPALAIHRDAHTGSTQPICPSERRELAALVGVHDFGLASILRVRQSMIATRYRNPRLIGR